MFHEKPYIWCESGERDGSKNFFSHCLYHVCIFQYFVTFSRIFAWILMKKQVCKGAGISE